MVFVFFLSREGYKVPLILVCIVWRSGEALVAFVFNSLKIGCTWKVHMVGRGRSSQSVTIFQKLQCLGFALDCISITDCVVVSRAESAKAILVLVQIKQDELLFYQRLFRL